MILSSVGPRVNPGSRERARSSIAGTVGTIDREAAHKSLDRLIAGQAAGDRATCVAVMVDALCCGIVLGLRPDLAEGLA